MGPGTQSETYTFDCYHIGKIIAPLFVYLRPQPLGLKLPQRSQLSDGVGCKIYFFAFSLSHGGVCHKKVGKIAFLVE